MKEDLNYIELTVFSASSDVREIVMARLIDTGFDAFKEEAETLSAYIPSGLYSEDLVKDAVVDLNCNYETREILHKNWNAEWESSFEPVKVEDFCMIRADFHSPDPVVLYDIVITPKMSFGTGHHATTFSMMDAMRKEDIVGKRLLDFGTGTGVLAILAEKMGAASVVAIDNDPWSIENGRENVLQNACNRIQLSLQDSIPSDLQFELILANINRNVIVENASAIASVLMPEGVVLLSGFLSADLPFITEAMEKHHINLTGYTENNGWLCVRGQLLNPLNMNTF